MTYFWLLSFRAVKFGHNSNPARYGRAEMPNFPDEATCHIPLII
jgi:hypothetical protein